MNKNKQKQRRENGFTNLINQQFNLFKNSLNLILNSFKSTYSHKHYHVKDINIIPYMIIAIFLSISIIGIMQPQLFGLATFESTEEVPLMSTTEICACDGGIEFIELQTALPYSGGTVNIEARAAKKDHLYDTNSDLYGVDNETFNGIIINPNTFTDAVSITRIESNGTHALITFIVNASKIGKDKMDSETDYRVTLNNLSNEVRLHTSCSQPIGPPFEFEEFLLISFIDDSQNNCNYELGCGNGVVEDGEECDDGNNQNGDGCSSECQISPLCICDGGIEIIEMQTALPYTYGTGTIEARAAKKDHLYDTNSDLYGVDIEQFNGTSFNSSSYSDAVAITQVISNNTHLIIDFIVNVTKIGKDKMDTETDYKITYSSTTNTSNEVRLHTSCSDPIGPPFEFEEFFIKSYYDNSQNYCYYEPGCGNGVMEEGEECDDNNQINGDGCSDICEIESECECDGGIEVMELQTSIPYTSGTVNVEARVAKKDKLDDSYPYLYGVDNETFNGTLFNTVSYSDAVAITHIDSNNTHLIVKFVVNVTKIGKDKMDAETDYRISINGIKTETRIHTSCSNPIAPPYDFDNFTVISFVDNEGAFCFKDDYCGNYIIELGEECDDGNNQSGDGCSSTCQIENVSICGNSIIETPEQCDPPQSPCTPGYNSSCIYCGPVCSNITLNGPYCGDNITNGPEQCDDNNTMNGDGCSSTCLLENISICGNGIIEPPEQCDDNNTMNGDGCSSTCQLENITVYQAVHPILECVQNLSNGSYIAYFGYQNDNNQTINIPINSNYPFNKFTPAPINRSQPNSFLPGRTPYYPNANFSVLFDGLNLVWTLTGPDNLTRTATASNSSLRCNITIPEECGNGIVEPPEECDDNNTLNGDGCSSNCTIEQFDCEDDFSCSPVFDNGFKFEMRKTDNCNGTYEYTFNVTNYNLENLEYIAIQLPCNQTGTCSDFCDDCDAQPGDCQVSCQSNFTGCYRDVNFTPLNYYDGGYHDGYAYGHNRGYNNYCGSSCSLNYSMTNNDTQYVLGYNNGFNNGYNHGYDQGYDTQCGQCVPCCGSSIPLQNNCTSSFTPPIWPTNNSIYQGIKSNYTVLNPADCPECSIKYIPINSGINNGSSDLFTFILNYDPGDVPFKIKAKAGDNIACTQLNCSGSDCGPDCNVSQLKLQGYKDITANSTNPQEVNVTFLITTFKGPLNNIYFSDFVPPGAQVSNLTLIYHNNQFSYDLTLIKDIDFTVTVSSTNLSDGTPVDVHLYNLSYNFTSWNGYLYSNDTIYANYDMQVLGGGNWTLPTSIAAFDPSYQKFITTETSDTLIVPLFDINVKVLNNIISMSDNQRQVKALLKMWNVGGPDARLDVMLTYSIKRQDGTLVVEKAETFAVQGTKEKELILPLPTTIQPGIYNFEALVTYADREALSTDIIEVIEQKIINTNYIFYIAIVTLSITLFYFVRRDFLLQRGEDDKTNRKKKKRK
ncbi:myxococcus cysteine-rich repeat containing protein [Nanoarchaeota archaeon]